VVISQSEYQKLISSAAPSDAATSAESAVTVQTVSNVVLNKKLVKRIWDKKNYCLFCGQPSKTLSRHMLQKHNDEVEVLAVPSRGKSTSERRRMWKSLTNRGNFSHNCKVVSSGTGEVVVAKRSGKGKTVTVFDYVPCPYCQGMYSRYSLYRHKKRCQARPSEKNPQRTGLYLFHALCCITY